MATYLELKVSCKNVLDETVKIINFIKSQPLSTHLYNILCEKIGGRGVDFCYKPKYEGCLMENHLCNCLSHELNYPLFSWNTMNWQTEELTVWQTFSQKWMMWTCHFQGNNWQCLLPVIKFEASMKIKILKNLTSTIMNLQLSQHLKTFLNEIGGDINE